MKYVYIISNFIAFIPILILWSRHGRKLRPYIGVLTVVCMVGLINTLAEGPAMRWGIWFYNIPKTLGITLWGALFETYLYCVLVPLAIGSAALIFADREDGKRAKPRKKSS